MEHVARTSTIRIATERDDGSEVVTQIWGVVVDGIPYIRNGYGERSKWYRRVRRTSRIAFVDDARRYPGTIDHVADEEMIRRVDDAYKAKYAGARDRARADGLFRRALVHAAREPRTGLELLTG